MLAVNPEERLKLNEIMHHPWVQSNSCRRIPSKGSLTSSLVTSDLEDIDDPDTLGGKPMLNHELTHRQEDIFPINEVESNNSENDGKGGARLQAYNTISPDARIKKYRSKVNLAGGTLNQFASSKLYQRLQS